MKKTMYILSYRDFIGRKCTKEYDETCIVSVVNEAKKFMKANGIKVGRIITPTGKEYYV